MDRGAWWAAVRGVAKSWIQLSNKLIACRKELDTTEQQTYCTFNLNSML